MEIEGLRMKGIIIKDLLLPKFVHKLEDEGITIEAVSLVFIKEGAQEGAGITPFVFSHQNSKEVKDKILHLSGAGELDLKKVSEIIKDLNT